jgi:hypothetical protein
VGGIEDLERCDSCGEGLGVYETLCPACGATLVDKKLEILTGLRDGDWITDDAFVVMKDLLVEGPAPRDGEAPVDRVLCKGLAELTIDDLNHCPVWEFALDDEGEPGQDEETVRAPGDLTAIDPVDGIFVVSALFTAADGTVFKGYVTPSETGDRVESPAIITDAGKHIPFWHGILEPGPAALEEEYSALAKQPPELFPIRVETLVPVRGDRLYDKIDGFGYFDAEAPRVIT